VHGGRARDERRGHLAVCCCPGLLGRGTWRWQATAASPSRDEQVVGRAGVHAAAGAAAVGAACRHVELETRGRGMVKSKSHDACCCCPCTAK
jgi:hypothetical protein